MTARRGISLEPEDDRALVEIAERHDGGNVSRTVRRLIRREWAFEREHMGDTERRQPETERVPA